MSHYSLAVILPDGTPNDPASIEAAINRALAPFDENLVVPPYQKKCGCVGAKANEEANKIVAALFGEIINKNSTDDILRRAERVIGKWDSFGGSDTDIKNQRIWEAVVEGHRHAALGVAGSLPNIEEADSKCEECGGSGLVESTYNPNSKWDWWVVGGRWAGHMRRVKVARNVNSPASFQPALAAVAEDDNIATGAYCLAAMNEDNEHSFFSALTPDGKWHESARMGWWGAKTGAAPRNQWRDHLKGLFAAHSNNICVCVDCHI